MITVVACIIIMTVLVCSFAEAEVLARRSLSIRERAFGSDDPLTATSLNNLALLLKDANQLVEAETMCRKCIDIRYAHVHHTVCTGQQGHLTCSLQQNIDTASVLQIAGVFLIQRAQESNASCC